MTQEAAVYRRVHARYRAILDVLEDAGSWCSTTHVAATLGRTNRSTMRDLREMEALGQVKGERNPSTAWWSRP